MKAAPLLLATWAVSLIAADREGPGLPKGWRERRFGGTAPASFSIARESDNAFPVLCVRAASAASMAICDVPEPPTASATLRWFWKVGASLPAADLRKKERDDAAARVLVGFRYEPKRFSPLERLAFETAREKGRYPPGATICYVWANRERAGEHFASPVSERIRILVLRSGDAEAGAWVDEARDLAADYRALFGDEPPPVESVAVMADTDATGVTATAWFRGLTLEAGVSGSALRFERDPSAKRSADLWNRRRSRLIRGSGILFGPIRTRARKGGLHS